MDEAFKKRVYFWSGLFLMLVFYCLYYLYFLARLSPEISLRARHIGKCIFIIIAYLTGFYSLRKQVPGWAIFIWHAAYGFILLVLVVMGVFDWGVARTSESLRVVAYDLQEFLVSPILYIVLVLVGRLTI
jgi:hypothetical protein